MQVPCYPALVSDWRQQTPKCAATLWQSLARILEFSHPLLWRLTGLLRTQGKTPLLWAVVRGHAECVRELAEAGANLGPIGDWLDQPGLGLLPYLPSLSEKLGVKYPDDLPGITKEDLKAIGMKPVEITRFIAAAQKLKAPSIPSSAAPVAGSIPFQPRPFPSLGASPAQKAGHGEALATMHMRAFGFHDAVVSGCAKRGEFPNDWSGLLAKAIAYVNEKDGGIDICASGAVAQVKSEFAGKPIGEPILRDFYGAASKGHTTQRRLFYAGPRGYSPEAAKWAGETDIALFTFTDQGVVSPENDLARDLVSAAQPSGAAGANKHKRSAPAGPCTGWRKEQVQQWLESCEFEAFAGSFSIVDGSDLKGLTAADLATLQPPILGFSAKKLLQAIRQLEPSEV